MARRETLKRKRIKAVLLAVVCSTAAVFSPMGNVLAEGHIPGTNAVIPDQKRPGNYTAGLDNPVSWEQADISRNLFSQGPMADSQNAGVQHLMAAARDAGALQPDMANNYAEVQKSVDAVGNAGAQQPDLADNGPKVQQRERRELREAVNEAVTQELDQELAGAVSDTGAQQREGQEPPDSSKPSEMQVPDSSRSSDEQSSDSGEPSDGSSGPSDGSSGPPDEQPSDGSSGPSDGSSEPPDEQPSDGYSEPSDGSGQNPEGQIPDQEQPGEAEPDQDDPAQDEEERKDTIKVTVSVSLNKNGTYADVSWKKTGDGKVSSYLVQRSSSRNGKYKTIARPEAGKKYTDKKVKSAQRCYYRIAAKTESGDLYYSKARLFQCPVEPLSGVRLVRYSTTSIKVMWDQSKNKKAKWYKVYYAKSKTGKFKLAGVTKNSWYRVKNLKNGQDYYFGVKACTTKKESGFDSMLSKTAKMKTVPYERTTIFAGDSITTGLSSYHILDEIAIGGKKSVVAAIGLNTMTFRTKKVFNGKSGVESIVAARPYRVYIMLGDNDIHFRNKNDLIDGYREIVRAIKEGTPDTDIVILAASPVTAAEVSRRKGFAQIPAYNQGLSALAKEMGVKYFDCTGFLKDSTGWLKSAYNAGDGVHWQPAAYHEYARRLTAYDKSQD
ncbi:MAG: hypothetical protein HFH30_08290 [Eubacterium sp.]|nr:hypothetical protein [Eubacterium sp.]